MKSVLSFEVGVALLVVILACLMSWCGNVIAQQPIKSRIVSTLLNKKDANRPQDLIEMGQIYATTFRKGRNGEEDSLLFLESGYLKSYGLVSKNFTTLFSSIYYTVFQMALNPLNNDEVVFHHNAQLLKLNIKTLTSEKLAGTGTFGYNGDYINATSAQIQSVQAITYNSNNELVFADTNRIRKILLNGTIVTIAGTSQACDGVTTAMSNIPAASASMCSITAVLHVKFVGYPEEWIYFRDSVGVKRIDPSTGLLSIVYQFSFYYSFYLNPIQSDRASLIPDDLWLGYSSTVMSVLKNNGLTQVIAGGGQDQTYLVADAKSVALSTVTSFSFDPEKNEMYIGTNGAIVKYVRSDRTIRHVVGCASNNCVLRGINIDAQYVTMSSTKPNIYFDAGQLFLSDNIIIKGIDLKSRVIKNSITHPSIDSINYMIYKNGLIYLYEGYYSSSTLLKYNQTSKVVDKIAGNYWYTEGGLAISNSVDSLSSFSFNSKNEMILSVGDQIRIIRNDARMYTLIPSSSYYAVSDNASFAEARIYSPSQLNSHPTRDNEMYFMEASKNVIRKMDFTTSRILTVAGKTNGFTGDGYLATDSAIKVNCFTIDEYGNIYFTDGAKLRKIDQADLRISSLTSSTSSYSLDGTDLSSLSLSASSCVLSVKNNVIYLAEDKSIRKIHPTCNSGYILTTNGNGCVACPFGLTNDEYFYECVPQCFGKVNSNACSNNGKCTAENMCTCNPGWSGSECSQTTCFGISNSASNVCSGRGSCQGFDSCKCQDGFRGKNCEFVAWNDGDVTVQTDQDEYVYRSTEPMVFVKFNTTYSRSVTLKIEQRSSYYNSIRSTVYKNLTAVELTNVFSQKFINFNLQYGHVFEATVFDAETGVQLSNAASKDVNVISCATCQVNSLPVQYFMFTYNTTRPNPWDPISLRVSMLQNFGYLFTFDIIVKFNNATYLQKTITTVASEVTIDIPPTFENGTLITYGSLYGQPFYKNSTYLIVSGSTSELAVYNQTLFVEDSWISSTFSVDKIPYKSTYSTSTLDMKINHIDFTSLFKYITLTANVTIYMINENGIRQNQIYSSSQSFLGSNPILSIQVPKTSFSIRSDWTVEGYITILNNGTIVSNEKKTLKPITFYCPSSYFGPQCDLTICNGVYSNSSNVCSGNGNCAYSYCYCNQNFKGSNCEMPSLKSSSVITKLDAPYKVKGSLALSNFTFGINSSDSDFFSYYRNRSLICYVYAQSTSSNYLGYFTLDKTNDFSITIKVPDTLAIGTYSFRLNIQSSNVIIVDTGSFYISTLSYVVGSQPLPPPIVVVSNNKPKVSTNTPNRETTTLSEATHNSLFLNNIWTIFTVILLMIFTINY